MTVTIELDWKNANEDQRSGWLVFTSLPDKFLEEVFDSLNVEQRKFCLECQTGNSNWVTKFWHSYTNPEKRLALQHHKLPFQFIESVWEEAEPTQRMWIVLTQPLPKPFIERIWNEIDHPTKRMLLLGQKLPLGYALEKWPDLTRGQKAAAFGIDCNLASSTTATRKMRKIVEGFIEEVDLLRGSLEEDGEGVMPLPELLVSANKLVRAFAQGCMDRKNDHQS